MASDLAGLNFLDLNAEHRARHQLRRWLSSLNQDDRVDAGFARIRHDRDDAIQRLEFEKQANRELREKLTAAGGTDLTPSTCDQDLWKLLFDFDFFWEAVELFVAQYSTPQAWFDALRSHSEIADQINWSQLGNVSRTPFYVAKALRVVRRSETAGTFETMTASLPPDSRAQMNGLAARRRTALLAKQDEG